MKFARSHRFINGKECSKCHTAKVRTRELRKKYNLTRDGVEEIRQRQHGRCLGCMRELPRNYCIDHDHATGLVRGLLCRSCNLTLGMVREDKAVLTRLRLYLDRDPSKQSIYLIGSLRNRGVSSLAAELRKHGFIVWDEWLAAGPDADDYWRDYEKEKGHDMAQALKGLAAQNVFYFDKSLIDLADIGVLVMPCGKSAHLELGYMAAQGKPTYVLLDKPPERFDVMAEFASGVTTDIDKLVVWVKRSEA